MAIYFHQETKEFHMCNGKVSYLMKVLENGQLGHLYYGKVITDREDFSHLVEYVKRDMGVSPIEGRGAFTLEHLMQEYPCYGNGDMRYAAFELERQDGSRIFEFKYKSHQIFAGKKQLNNLPAVYVLEDKEAQTLEITLEDALTDVSIVLSYTIFSDFPVITKNVRFVGGKKEDIDIISCMSGCLDFPNKEFEMVELAGTWAKERHVHTRKLGYGIQGIYSMRGCSSHQFNPFLLLKTKSTDEFSGEAYGFSFVYSGDFIAQVEVDNFDVTRVLVGIHPNEFRWYLKQKEVFQTPELVMVYSENGINDMSQTYHEIYRTRLARGVWKERERPILINNWEATYFDFDEDKILAIAEKSREVGIELFVLDDGWFGKRNHDKCSLGDWYPNLEKLPNGIVGLSEKVEELGLKFGLWIEPEMVNKDSDLYRQHPDWVLADIRRNFSHARNQYVLDFSKEVVVDYVYKQISEILKTSRISYIKWDMNRSFSEVFSNGNDIKYQGEVRHRYILGVYRLYERLLQEFPHILFESCASGGARFDPGMLYYAPQAWTSDNTDAVDRIKIQYGTSYVYPLSSIGSHVSASPNHQVFRHTSLETRANVAFFGTFGYELDITQMKEEEHIVLRKQVEFMKCHRKLIQSGTFYRLKSPFESNSSAWQVVDKDMTKSLFVYYRILQPIQGKLERIYLKGLVRSRKYVVKECFGTQNVYGEYYGDELMSVGFSVADFSCGMPDMDKESQGDFFSRLFSVECL